MLTDGPLWHEAFLFDPTFSEPEAGRDRRGLPFNSDHARDIYSRTMDALMQTQSTRCAWRCSRWVSL